MDSKRLHKAHDIAPLESVALGLVTWCTGFTPGSAAELFALLGEHAEIMDHVPWCQERMQLSLPYPLVHWFTKLKVLEADCTEVFYTPGNSMIAGRGE